MSMPIRVQSIMQMRDCVVTGLLLSQSAPSGLGGRGSCGSWSFLRLKSGYQPLAGAVPSGAGVILRLRKTFCLADYSLLKAARAPEKGLAAAN
jgi:hypothetical protein